MRACTFIHGVARCSKYLERYGEALASFEAAGAMDASLDCDGEMNEIVHRLGHLGTLIATQCGLKQKRVAKLMQAVQVAAQRFERTHGGPSGGKLGGTRRSVGVRGLRPGAEGNAGSLVHCKIVHGVGMWRDMRSTDRLFQSTDAPTHPRTHACTHLRTHACLSLSLSIS